MTRAGRGSGLCAGRLWHLRESWKEAAHCSRRPLSPRVGRAPGQTLKGAGQWGPVPVLEMPSPSEEQSRTRPAARGSGWDTPSEEMGECGVRGGGVVLRNPPALPPHRAHPVPDHPASGHRASAQDGVGAWGAAGGGSTLGPPPSDTGRRNVGRCPVPPSLEPTRARGGLEGPARLRAARPGGNERSAAGPRGCGSHRSPGVLSSWVESPRGLLPLAAPAPLAGPGPRRWLGPSGSSACPAGPRSTLSGSLGDGAASGPGELRSQEGRRPQEGRAESGKGAPRSAEAHSRSPARGA